MRSKLVPSSEILMSNTVCDGNKWGDIQDFAKKMAHASLAYNPEVNVSRTPSSLQSARGYFDC